MKPEYYDALIIGAGASGLMAAARASQMGRRVLLLDHGAQPGAKIMISGGGRCNFTNLHSGAGKYISANPRFCLSALKSFGPKAFLDMVQRHEIEICEKDDGQLFCDGPARQIVQMLLDECHAGGVDIHLRETITECGRTDRFYIQTAKGRYEAANLVLATGGLSIPKLGATGFALDLATQFGLPVLPVRPGLVPLTFKGDKLALMRELSGLSIEARVSCGKTVFADDVLFTHRGLSGPAILQISSYWQEGQAITLNLVPQADATAFLLAAKKGRARAHLRTILSELLPARLAYGIALGQGDHNIADLQDKTLRELGAKLNRWVLNPESTEGYEKAEVTTGGIDTRSFSSKTLECQSVPGLFVTGEALDVTGWLGGYNLQWAWSSGWVAGTTIGQKDKL
jgi:predicted Rossmann fold flavoprotein